MMKLYRGIAIAESDLGKVCNDIQTNGLYFDNNRQWQPFEWKDLRRDLDKLYSNPGLTLDETRLATKWISTSKGGYLQTIEEGCKGLCFADKFGAEYYAKKHYRTSERNFSLIVTVDVPCENVIIDGRDFLYTAFQRFEKIDISKANRQKEKLMRIFGVGIEKYVNKLFDHPNSNPIAICDLVVNDTEIINSHYLSREVIGGRYGTTFCNAFIVKAPIEAARICAIDYNDDTWRPTAPTITLNDFFERV